MDPGEIDRLYTVGLERFVAERNEVAKRLRRAGEREQAATVAGLTKPTPAAWAINGLARGDPDLVGELMEAGTRLRDAVARASGGDPDDVRSALRAQRDTVRRLVDRARETVRVQGRPLSPAMVERVQTTLLAAAADPELAECIRAGRLERDIEVTRAFEPPTLPPSRPRAARQAATATDEESGSGPTRQRRRAAEQHERATQGQRREARQQREAQQRRADRQRREEERRAALAQLRRGLMDRRVAERAAAERADAARSQLERARAAARGAEEALARAEAEAAERAREVERLRSELRALGATDD